MRVALIAVGSILLAAAAAPAFALNPQPLPPGARPATQEPPDPCVKVTAAREHEACVRAHKPKGGSAPLTLGNKSAQDSWSH